MKPFDYVLLTISILWSLFYLTKIFVLLGSREVKYMGAKVTVGWYIPVFPMVCWLVIAYRVGG